MFVQTSAPTDDGLHALLHTVIARLMKRLTRRGVLVEDMGEVFYGHDRLMMVERALHTPFAPAGAPPRW